MPTRGDPRIIIREGGGGGHAGGPTRGGTRVIPPRGGIGIPPLPGPFPPPPPEAGPPKPLLPKDKDNFHSHDDRSRSRTLTFGGTGEILPILYGRRRVGGKVIFAQTKQNLLYLGIAICEGVIDSMSEFEIAKIPIKRLGLEPGNGKFNYYLGTKDQALDPILSAANENWVSALPGVAYVTMVLDINNDQIAKINPLEFQVTVKGRRVRDPAQDATLVNRFYSENPVLCLVDLMTDRRFGLGAPDSLFDWAGNITEQAAYCFETVAQAFGPPDSAIVATESPGLTGRLYKTHHGGPAEYKWFWTGVDFVGKETLPSAVSNTLTPTRDYVAGILQIPAHQDGGDIVSRRLYRTKADGELPARFVATIAGNDAVEFEDKKGDWELGGEAPILADALRYRLCLLIDRPMTAAQWIENILGHFCAHLAYNNGKYQIFIDRDQTASSITYDETNVSGIPLIRGREPTEIPTKVTVAFVNEEEESKNDTATFEEPNVSTPPSELVRKPKREFRYSYLGIPTHDQAFRVAKWHYARGLADKEIEWRTNQRGALPIPGTIVKIAHTAIPALGAPPGKEVLLTYCQPITGSIAWFLRGEFVVPEFTGYSPAPGPPTPHYEPPNPPPPVPQTNEVLRFTSWHTNPPPELPE